MRIAVLNGSPRGRFSSTIHSVLYLKEIFKEDTFDIIEVATRIRSLEKDLSPLVRKLEEADIVLFSYPVYTFLVPYQLHRAIELIKESGVDLSGKHAAQITTSKHFYDVTAQKFIEENAADLGMGYLRGFFADMDDLLTEKGRRQVVSWWEYVRFLYFQEHPEADGRGKERASEGRDGVPAEKNGGRIVTIVTDGLEDESLAAAIRTFQQECPIPTRIADLNGLHLKGGCISCFNCAADGTCIYKDGFSEFLREYVNCSSALVYAFRIKDHSMGSTFKLYDDRQFCNGHRMMTIGMPVGYIIKGDLSAEPNLKMLIDARADVGQNILCGIVGDGEGAERLHKMAERMEFALDHKTTLPQSFFGVGGTKIFRDLIWTMRGLMKADHRFYKEHGIYDDFPQRHIGKMLQMKLIGWMANNKKIRKRMGNRMNEGMAVPYMKVVEKAKEGKEL